MTPTDINNASLRAHIGLTTLLMNDHANAPRPKSFIIECLSVFQQNCISDPLNVSMRREEKSIYSTLRSSLVISMVVKAPDFKDCADNWLNLTDYAWLSSQRLEHQDIFWRQGCQLRTWPIDARHEVLGTTSQCQLNGSHNMRINSRTIRDDGIHFVVHYESADEI